MNYFETIKAYHPVNEQEVRDKELILQAIAAFPDILFRSNYLAHMTASSWIVNQERTKVLLVYHKIYDSWGWTGGHTDGEADFLKVAVREAKEETGLKNIKVISDKIYSLESLCVNGHLKNGKYVSSHLHLNLTYLLEADDQKSLIINPEENKGVRWFALEAALSAPSEIWMVENIYQKLNRKIKYF
ncbi:MAG: NUDIX hydrolase [Bacilli bacterium]|nr:NUDIX hydrolase [Bacilli bacterium]